METIFASYRINKYDGYTTVSSETVWDNGIYDFEIKYKFNISKLDRQMFVIEDKYKEFDNLFDSGHFLKIKYDNKETIIPIQIKYRDRKECVSSYFFDYLDIEWLNDQYMIPDKIFLNFDERYFIERVNLIDENIYDDITEMIDDLRSLRYCEMFNDEQIEHDCLIKVMQKICNKETFQFAQHDRRIKFIPYLIGYKIQIYN